jgi:hypothetical protein
MTRVQELERALKRATLKSAQLAEQRSRMPPGSSRARVTTANAKWSRAAEERERLERELAEARAEVPVPVVPPTPGPIIVEESAGGYVLKAESVGAGYYAGIGGATQRDPHPVHGSGISRETALANATLWAAASKGLAVAEKAWALLDGIDDNDGPLSAEAEEVRCELADFIEAATGRRPS